MKITSEGNIFVRFLEARKPPWEEAKGGFEEDKAEVEKSVKSYVTYPFSNLWCNLHVSSRMRNTLEMLLNVNLQLSKQLT